MVKTKTRSGNKMIFTLTAIMVRIFVDVETYLLCCIIFTKKLDQSLARDDGLPTLLR